MKKILSIVFVIVMVISAVPAMAENTFEFVGMTEISTLPKSTSGYSVIHKENGEYFRVSEEVLTQSEIDYLYDIFSDENLTCVASDYMEIIQLPDVFDEYSTFEFSQNNDKYSLYFDSEKVVVIVIFMGINTETYFHEFTVKQGLFEYKNPEIYNELVKFIKENSEEQEEKNKTNEFERIKNGVNISNFKFVYRAIFTYPLGTSGSALEIGVCSYLREGETKETVSAYCTVFTYEGMEDKYIWINLSETPQNNRFGYCTEREITINRDTGLSVEHDWREETAYNYLFDFQINVNDDMQADGIIVDTVHSKSGAENRYYIDMSTCEQTGKLPPDMFSPEYNIEYQEELDTTVTHEPSATATPSATPAPTAEPKPTASPKPTETPAPTEEAKATDEPKATSTPTPDESGEEEQKGKDEEVILLDYDFIDVPKGHWAYDVVHEFAEKKIVLGYGNGYFGVDDAITYEHFALLLDRLFEYDEENKERRPSIREDVIVSVVKALELDVSDADTNIINEKFSDCEGLKEENLKYIAKAIEEGLVIGSGGKLFPEENLTRAETVTLLSRAVKYDLKFR